MVDQCFWGFFQNQVNLGISRDLYPSGAYVLRAIPKVFSLLPTKTKLDEKSENMLFRCNKMVFAQHLFVGC